MVRHAGVACQSIRGRAIDEAISTLLLETMAPAALEVALAVEDEIAGRIAQATAQRETQLTRARYDTELARRRYINVDPSNRLVADRLEADWNECLRRLDALQQEHNRKLSTDHALLSGDARARIRQLAEDFPRVWNDPRVSSVERKRMVALLIEDVTLIKAERITMHVRMRGGQTTSLEIDKPKPIALIRKTLPEVVRKVDELLETCTDRQVAEHLNQLGYTNWRKQPFTHKKVIVIRLAYRLKSRLERLRERGMVDVKTLAKQLDVCTATIYHWGQAGYLKQHHYGNGHRCLFEPIGNVTVIKGQGGRYSPTPPMFIAAQSTTQGAI
jgi:hypothetical protein